MTPPLPSPLRLQAEASAQEAQQRAAAAEAAKIELTLALADAADARADEAGGAINGMVPQPVGVQPGGSSSSRSGGGGAADVDSLVQQAAAAEAEAAKLRGELAAQQARVKELEWQIQMAFGPQMLGGAAGDGGGGQGGARGAFGLADFLLGGAGCGANFVRKPS